MQYRLLVERASAILCLFLASPVGADVAIASDGVAYNSGAYGTSPNQTFFSSPIVAPIFHVATWDRSAVDPRTHLFLGLTFAGRGGGPFIFSAHDLSLVYADPSWSSAFDVRAQTLNGTRYLTFWEGVLLGGHANGYCAVFDETYTLKWNLTAQGFSGGALADLHEFKLTSDGGALFVVYENIPFDLRSVGGPEVGGLLMDNAVQEVDIATGQVLFEWRASEHFAITDSYGFYSPQYGVNEARGFGFDFFHINSIEKTTDGNYLISSRNLHSILLVSGKDGSVLWVLGGKRNQYEDLSGGNAINLGWQHDARFLAGNQSLLTYFDNHVDVTTAGSCTGDCSRGVQLELDPGRKTARLLQEYLHPAKLQSGAMGGLQPLPNGNVLTAWGTNPTIVEFNGSRPVLDVRLGMLGLADWDQYVYRAYKMDWVGHPSWPPSIAAVPGPGNTATNATVYMSWNGATEVASWVVLADNSTSSIDGGEKVIARSLRAGFETSIVLGSGSVPRYARAAALASNGTILGSTDAVDLRTGSLIPLSYSVASVGVQMTPTSKDPPATSSTSAPSETREGVARKTGTMICTRLFIIAAIFWNAF